MTLSRKAFFALFAIIIIEGYIVLSSELLAIRVTVPFIGSGTDVVSVIIAAVLLPLSFGYYYGGRFKPYTNRRGRFVGPRAKLANNILISTVFLVFGLSYGPLLFFMEELIKLGISNRIILASIYSGLFLIVPVFLLGQTIPLVSHYFSKEKLSRVTGKILFLSTIGSFLGATFSTLVLMATIGVHYTAALNFVLLTLLFFIVGRRKYILSKILIVVLMAVGIFFNSDVQLKKLNIVAFNQYNVIQIFEKPGTDIKIFSLNKNSDSLYSPTQKLKHEYAHFIENHYIYTRELSEEPLNILVLGAGGFTLGIDEDINIYHYVDIDPNLKDVAEDYFLGKELGPNKTFHPVAAESFLIQGDEKYDVIVLDAYQGSITLPENLVTQEFFQRVKKRLAPGGIVICNFIISPGFADPFSRNLDNTFSSVFPFAVRQVIGTYDGWSKTEMENVLFIYRQSPDENNLKIYTDNKNTVYYDKPKSR
ncbi:MAG TPA: fused MFS/spermidine synthase [Alphaproteobacteria bacterium]|jgi:spermidine synthase|nr:fused MFS/spermidine synthase [Micavibrio sp.]MBK9562923.1 fused MFS/spermidine synthase [Micavibrio sp.]HQX26703.1 fused MFS/spermidine synthase [Alphaproteobacteria bacterium]